MTTITHKKGDTLELTMQLKRDGSPVDITNYTITSQMRDSTDALLSTDNFDGSLTVTIIDASVGQFVLGASSTETSEWDTRTYDCDVQLLDGGNTSSSETFKIKVTKDITRV